MKKTMVVLLLCVTVFTLAACSRNESEEWVCSNCGNSAAGNLCGNCGTVRLPIEWICTNCRQTNIGNFCGNCGTAIPVDITPYRTVGGYVTFGHYEQDISTINGDEAIEWLVLDYDAANNRALLISRYGLDAKPYNTEYVDITWENCTLRAWLNGEFMSSAFTASEQSAILLTNVDNSSSQGYDEWSTDGGNNTQDKIFLLSCAEANKYFGVQYCHVSGSNNNTKSRVSPTTYAIMKGAFISGSDKTADGSASGFWWLRSPGSYQGFAAFVNVFGALYFSRVRADSLISGDSTDLFSMCVCPALWIDLNSALFN